MYPHVKGFLGTDNKSVVSANLVTLFTNCRLVDLNNDKLTAPCIQITAANVNEVCTLRCLIFIKNIHLYFADNVRNQELINSWSNYRLNIWLLRHGFINKWTSASSKNINHKINQKWQASWQSNKVIKYFYFWHLFSE